MNIHVRSLRRSTLWLADMIVSLLSFAIAVHIRFGTGISGTTAGLEIFYFSIALISTVISFGLNLDKNFMRRGWFDEIYAVFLHTAVLGLALITGHYFAHSISWLSRLLL